MEKKIQYLHLYLGCNVKVEGGMAIYTLEGVYKDRCAVREYGRRFKKYIEPKSVKPILRPLSDMTEEEAIEVAGLSEWEGHFRDVKVERNKFNDLIVSWDGITEGGETFNSTGELFYCSDQFIYLLSKQFDLFELIEYGLAIDKTKLPAHA